MQPNLLSTIKDRVLFKLSGPAGGELGLASGRLATARHEAAHAIIARAMGMHVGTVSAEPFEDVFGYASVSLKPIVRDADPAPGSLRRGKYWTDYHEAAVLAFLALPFPVSWRDILAALRPLRAEVRAMVRAHSDVIQEFAWMLLDAGTLRVLDANLAIERAERMVDDRVIAEYVYGQPVDDVYPAIEAIARLRAAAQELRAGDTAVYACAIVTATEAAADQLGADVQFLDELSLHQPRAVRRLALRLCSEAAEIVVGPESITVSLSKGQPTCHPMSA